MSGPLGPHLLKSCRVWWWFIPKTFQGLHFFVFWGTHLVDRFFELFGGETNSGRKRSVSQLCTSCLHSFLAPSLHVLNIKMTILFFQRQWHCYIHFYCTVAVWICQHFILPPLYAQISWIWHTSRQMFWPLQYFHNDGYCALFLSQRRWDL